MQEHGRTTGQTVESSTPPASLVFTVGDRTLAGNVIWLDATASPHTDATLARLRFSFVVRGDAGQREAVALQDLARRVGVGCAALPSVPSEWSLVSANFQTSGLPPFQPFTHEWELVERERLLPTGLLINGDHFSTFTYEERLEQSRLVVVARITTAGELGRFATVIRAGDELRVVREGISHETRRMHLELFVWTDQTVKIALVQLADRDGPHDHERDGISQCDAHRLRCDLARGIALQEALVTALATPPVTPTAIEDLAQASWPDVFLRQARLPRMP